MKYIKVKYINIPNSEIREGLWIETPEDLTELKALLLRAANSAARKLIASGESEDRFDHVLNGLRPIEKALCNLAVMQAKFTGDNAIFHLCNVREQHLSTVASILIKSEKGAFVNENGGVTPIDGHLEIVETSEYTGEEKVKPTIKENTKVINLENDLYVEGKANDFMRGKLNDKNFSYITEIRMYNEWRLLYAFQAFIKAGGELVYVYTTGRDVDQMYQYSESALTAGLKKFAFQFVHGTDPKIDRFLEWLGARAEVTVYPI